MGIEQIQKIHEFGEINVIISLLLCAMLVIALKAGWEKWSYVKKKYKLNTTNFLFLCNC